MILGKLFLSLHLSFSVSTLRVVMPNSLGTRIAQYSSEVEEASRRGKNVSAKLRGSSQDSGSSCTPKEGSFVCRCPSCRHLLLLLLLVADAFREWQQTFLRVALIPRQGPQSHCPPRFWHQKEQLCPSHSGCGNQNHSFMNLLTGKQFMLNRPGLSLWQSPQKHFLFKTSNKTKQTPYNTLGSERMWFFPISSPWGILIHEHNYQDYSEWEHFTTLVWNWTSIFRKESKWYQEFV